jgi:hypothetical protein
MSNVCICLYSIGLSIHNLQNLLDVIFCEPWCKHWQVAKGVLRPTLDECPGSNFLGTNLD